MLRRLPYAQAERIVAIQELNKDGKRVQVTPANFLDWRAQNTVFEHLAAILTRPANLALADQAERVDLAMTSANFFSVFGTEPERGRFFIPADEQAGHAPVVVISHALWQRRFGGDASLVGKPITLDGASYTVVGIAPAGFQYPDKTDVWVPPFRLAPTMNERMDPTQVRGFGMLAAVALLKPGVSLAQAASEMETITARLRQQYPDTNNRRFNRVVSLHTHLVGETGPMLLLLFGAVSFVLLIACANVANLLLASAATRQKEIAIRTALGASRLRVMQQLLTESLMLAFAGGAIGLLLALWGVALMTKLLPRDFPRLGEINLDWRVLGFTLVRLSLNRNSFRSRAGAANLEDRRSGVAEREWARHIEQPPAQPSAQSSDRWRGRVVSCAAGRRWSLVSQLPATAIGQHRLYFGTSADPAADHRPAATIAATLTTSPFYDRPCSASAPFPALKRLAR